MNRFLSAIFAFLVLTTTPTRAQDARWDARLADVSGEVVVLAADGSPEVSGTNGMPLEEGDRVVVAEGGLAEVSLDGGNLITVRGKSDFKIEKTDKNDSSFFLKVGSLLAKIQKLGPRRLRVRTPAAVAAVRGTEFGVEVEGENSHIGVFDEGKVEVTGESGGTPELLISNQETSVVKGQMPAHAAQLKRFVAHRGQMRGQRRRLAGIKARWEVLNPSQRQEMRKKMLKSMRERREKFLEKRGAMKPKMEQNLRLDAERGRQWRQENLRKMDERRRQIKRGGERGTR